MATTDDVRAAFLVKREKIERGIRSGDQGASQLPENMTIEMRGLSLATSGDFYFAAGSFCCVFSRVILWKSNSPHPIPSTFPLQKIHGSIPQHFQPRGRNPCLAAFECFIDESNEHSRRALSSESQHLNIGERINLA
ncbi:MAG: hypothetical protein WCP28_02455 [Actinomycetes bacterium]